MIINKYFNLTNYVLEIPENLDTTNIEYNTTLSIEENTLLLPDLFNLKHLLGTDLSIENIDYKITRAEISQQGVLSLIFENVIRKILESTNITIASIDNPFEILRQAIQLNTPLYKYFNFDNINFISSLLEYRRCYIDESYSGNLKDFIERICNIAKCSVFLHNGKISFKPFLKLNYPNFEITNLAVSFEQEIIDSFLYNQWSVQSYNDFNNEFKNSREKFGEKILEFPASVNIYPNTLDGTLYWNNYYKEIVSGSYNPRKKIKIKLPLIDLNIFSNYILNNKYYTILSLNKKLDSVDSELLEIL